MIAAGLAVGIIAVGLLAHVFAAPLAIGSGALEWLRVLVGVAVGAVFGAGATVNGLKPDIQAANVRLDAIHAPPSAAAVRIVADEAHVEPDAVDRAVTL